MSTDNPASDIQFGIVSDTDTQENASQVTGAERQASFANRISMVQAAQIVLLQRQNVVDDAAANAMLRAVDSVQLGYREPETAVWAVTEALEDRLGNGKLPLLAKLHDVHGANPKGFRHALRGEPYPLNRRR